MAAADDLLRNATIVRLRARLAPVFAALRWVWESDLRFLVVLSLFEIFLTRRTFAPGIWADSDSVCHYAYLRHLVDEFYPATGSALGWSPKFNVGIPFLLYNTPPGLYVSSGVVAAILHVDALLGLKLVMTAAYVAVPIAGYAFARSFHAERTSAPKFVAVALMLFSGELFGLEFFFHNGMLNPALGLPLMLGALACYRHAQRRELPRALGYLALGGVLSAALICTHVLSAYMLCIGLVGLTFGAGLKDVGASAIKAGVVLALGAAISAYWLYPSMKFAAPEDAAYTWLRRPEDTLSSFFDGSLISSYFGGFFVSFIVVANVGFVAVVAGVYGLGHASRTKTWGVIGAAVGFALALGIALGPKWSFLAHVLPAYDRLLWYRFVTLAVAMWLVVAGYGAWALSSRELRIYPLNLAVLAVGAGWALAVLVGRSDRIRTAASFPQFTESVDTLAKYLREKGDKRGRVFGEFLGQGIVEPPSVNYTRHMLPTLSGMREVSGWIYENNPASRVLMKKGPFWYDPLPMIALAPAYDVKYIVAGSPQFIQALSQDPRWKPLVYTTDLVLFEALGYEPAVAVAEHGTVRVVRESYVRGGGYEYELEADATATDVVVKTNWSPAWTADAGGAAVPVESTDDGLIRLRLPPRSGPARIRLTWDIGAWKHTGGLISLAGLAAALALLAASRARRIMLPVATTRAAELVGRAGIVAALALTAWRSRSIDLSRVGFGAAGGLDETYRPRAIDVGAFYDTIATYPVHLLPDAWGDRRSAGGRASRALLDPEAFSARVALAPRSPNRIKVDLEAAGGEPFAIEIGRRGGAEPLCVVTAQPSQWTALPAACAADPGAAPGADAAREDTRDSRVDGREHGIVAAALPGRAVDVRIRLPKATGVAAIAVDNDMRFVQAESFTNAVDDGGSDAFYGNGTPDTPVLNGASLVAEAPAGRPIVLRTAIDLAPRAYDVWILARTWHPRFRNSIADVRLLVDGAVAATFDDVAREHRRFWESDGAFEWERVGALRGHAHQRIELSIERRPGATDARADIDALAFVPSSDGP